MNPYRSEMLHPLHDRPQPSKARSHASRSLLLLAAVAALSCTGSRPVSPETTRDALTLTEIACIFASNLLDAPALASYCRIDPRLAPIIADLIGQREGARRAGVRWPSDADAGTGDAGR